MMRSGDKPSSIEVIATLRGSTIAMLEEASAHLELMRKSEINKGLMANIRKLAIEHIELSRSYQRQLHNWNDIAALSKYGDSIKLIEEALPNIIKISKEILERSSCLL
jgi:hypothetical protein